MSNYTRYRIPGGTYFFTTYLHDRRSCLLVENIEKLRHVTRQTMLRYPFEINAIAVLPAAIHTIWTLPPGDSDYSKRWRLLKSLFSRGLPAPPNCRASHIARGEKGLWQRRFWEHSIRDAADYAVYERFIHAAPVISGLVTDPNDWPFCSLHRNRANPATPGLRTARQDAPGCQSHTSHHRSKTPNPPPGHSAAVAVSERL